MPILWHRLVGISFTDVFTFYPFRVETELELSKVAQRLDFAIIEQTDTTSQGPWPELPDGLQDVASYNLVTFKSLQQTLDAAAMLEFLGQFVIVAKEKFGDQWNIYCQPKQTWARLLAVAVCRPRWLKPKYATSVPGVYEVDYILQKVRVIVPREMAPIPRNAVWGLLSGKEERILQGVEHYKLQNSMLRNFVDDLLKGYQIQGVQVTMPYTIADYRKDVLAQFTPEERLAGLDPEIWLKGLPPELRLKGLDPELRLKGLDPELRLKGLDPELRLKGLDPELRLKGLDPELRLKGLTKEQLERYLDTLKHEPEPPAK